jgi:hypothetical protein
LDAGVTERVLALALVVVGGFGGEGVADEFGIEVTGMIGRLQRNAEVVHGENVFEKFGLLEITDAAGLAGGVEGVGEGVGAGVEVMVVARLVDANAPQHDGGMIPVAANHAADVVDGDVLPGLVADVLPARDFFQHEEAEFVAGIEEMA